MTVEKSFALLLKPNSMQPNRRFIGTLYLFSYWLLSRGHENFSQSTEEVKPLTPEEVKAKLEELKKAAAERKAAQAIKDKEEEKKNLVRYTQFLDPVSDSQYLLKNLLDKSRMQSSQVILIIRGFPDYW